MDAGASEAAATLEPLVADMAKGIARSADPRRAQAAIAAAVSAFDTDALDEAIFAANVVAEMAGDLMVRQGEKGAPRRLELAPPRGDLPGDDDDPFVDRPWGDAVEWFKARGNVTDADLARLLNDAAARSREERQKLLAHVQETTYARLADAIEEGKTYGDFATELRTGLVPIGVTAEDDGYLQMVFRTNVQAAYSAGRDRASKDPEIIAERPFALYLTAGDGLVRSEHAEYAERNNGVYRIGSPEWEAVRPPPKDSPFNCRCSWVTLTTEQARERGADV